MFDSNYSAGALILGLALAAGCSTTDPGTELPVDETELLDAAELGRQRPVSITDIRVDEALAVLCEVKASFEVDEARDHSGDTSFGEIATCFNDGALQGRSLELFAYMSPVEDTFTRHHGDTRINAVRAHLIDNGFAVDDITVHAEGTLDEHQVGVRVVPRHDR
jgi:hypothetical protein